MRRRNVWALGGILAVALAAGMAWSVNPRGQTGTTTLPRSQAPDGKIVRIIHDGERRPVAVEYDWPFDDPFRIGQVRVPWGYRHLMWGPSPGGQLSSNIHRESLERGYTDLYFYALLPGARPHEGVSPEQVTRPGNPELLSVSVSPLIHRRAPTWDPDGWRRKSGLRLMRNLNIAHPADVPNVPLEPRFGLNRIGPTRVADPRPLAPNGFGPNPHYDLYFDGPTPTDSRTVILCGSDFRADGALDPEWRPRALCQHEFVHEGLRAAVQASYTKANLSSWRDIETNVSRVIDSFK